MSELQKALAKYLRGLQYHDYAEVLADVREEIADVQIMIDQLKMIFDDGEKLMFTYHSPNKKGFERPAFVEIADNGDSVSVKR